MLTAETLTNDDMRAFCESLPMVSTAEFVAGGEPGSPARWWRICHAAYHAANAMPERKLIADEINRRRMERF